MTATTSTSTSSPAPKRSRPADQVAILSQVLDRDLRYAESDPADMLAQMVSYGMPEELAHAVVEMFRTTLEPLQLQADWRHHRSHEPPGTQLHRLGRGAPHRAPHTHQLVNVMPATAVRLVDGSS